MSIFAKKPVDVELPSDWEVEPLPEDATATTANEGGELMEIPVAESDDPHVTGPLERGSGPLVWTPAHGGAGVTSLAQGTEIGEELETWWDRHDTVDEVGRLLVVCRSNTAGLDAAMKIIGTTETPAAGAPVAALVVVADSPKRPSKTIRTRLREISGTVPLLVEVPWIEQWRDRPYTRHPALEQLRVAITNSIPLEGPTT